MNDIFNKNNPLTLTKYKLTFTKKLSSSFLHKNHNINNIKLKRTSASDSRSKRSWTLEEFIRARSPKLTCRSIELKLGQLMQASPFRFFTSSLLQWLQILLHTITSISGDEQFNCLKVERSMSPKECNYVLHFYGLKWKTIL